MEPKTAAVKPTQMPNVSEHENVPTVHPIPGDRSLSEEWEAVSMELAQFSKSKDDGAGDELDLMQPVALCNSCGETLSSNGSCSNCEEKSRKPRRKKATTRKRGTKKRRSPASPETPTASRKRKKKRRQTTEKPATAKSSSDDPSAEDEFWEMVD